MLANFNEAIEDWATKLDQALSSPPRTPPRTPSSAVISVKGSSNYVAAQPDSPPLSGASTSSSASQSPFSSPSAASVPQSLDPSASPDEVRLMQYLRSHKVAELRSGCPRTRKIALRGIPDSLRAQFWKQITGAKGMERKNAGVYASLLTHRSPAEALIQADVIRTLSAHQFFEKNGHGQKALFNVLRAYSIFDLELEYCQGTSFVAALLLLHMSEEEAFWVLVQIIKTYHLRDLYTHSLPLLRKMVYVFDRLLQSRYPRLFSHFKSQSVTPQLFASQWFTSLFSVPFQSTLTIRVWDLLFCDGPAYMYRAALAVLELCQDELLGLAFDEMMPLLKHKAKMMAPEALIRQAEKISLNAQDMRLYESEYTRAEQVKSEAMP